MTDLRKGVYKSVNYPKIFDVAL